jgi:hypothetical protein
MSELDDFLSDFLRAEPLTLFGAWGPSDRGWSDVAAGDADIGRRGPDIRITCASGGTLG